MPNKIKPLRKPAIEVNWTLAANFTMATLMSINFALGVLFFMGAL